MGVCLGGGFMKKDIEMSLARLPADIQAFVKRKVAFCITIFLLAEAIAVLLITSILNSSFKLEPISLAVVCVLLVVCPFLISGFPRKLIDKPWRGKITKVDIDTKVDSRLVGGKPIVYVKNTIVLTIEKENGKVCTKEVLSLGSRSNNTTNPWDSRDTRHGMDHYAVGDVTHDIENYRVGDEVYHFWGLDDLICRREGGRDIVECVACSTTNPAHRKECFCCGRTLVNFSDGSAEE